MGVIIEAFFLSLIARLGTGIGGIITAIKGDISNRFISVSMGFASGVMLLVSFLNLFIESLDFAPYLVASIAFVVGSIFMIFFDLFLPHLELGKKEDSIMDSRMFRSGLLILIGITLHNIPEGVIISAGYAHLPQLGILIAVTIFFHNLPEGIATAIPLISSGSKKANVVLLTLISGLTEPIGAILGGTLLLNANKETIGLTLAFAAGVMTYITADELLPIAHETGNKHATSIGLLLGIAFILFLNNLFQI
jgi:ZIP family zinc transporter